MIDVLIPVAKGYITDRAFDLCSLGVEVFGGYGFTKEYPQEQLLRDCKITQIYEGTNSIQAMDLLGRKLGLNNGQAFTDLIREVENTIETVKSSRDLGSLANSLAATLDKLMKTAQALGSAQTSGKVHAAFLNARPFLDVVGDTLLSWMLLWRAGIAEEKLAGKPKKKDVAFYEGQLSSARFFIQTVLPATSGKMDAILNSDTAALDISDASFG